MTTASHFAGAVVELGRRVVEAGLVLGSGGNVSVRRSPDEVLVTPSGYALDRLGWDDLVTLGLDGEVRAANDGRRPSSESSMHLAAYRARPDAGVALHVHPPYVNVLLATGRPIRLLTVDHAYYVRRMVQLPWLPTGSEELSDAVATAMERADVVLIAHHGCLVVASDTDAAFERAANLEAAATATYRALLLGDDPAECPPAYLERIEAQEAGGVRHGTQR